MKSIHHSSPVKKKKRMEQIENFSVQKVMRVKFSPGKDKQGRGSDYIHEK